MSKYISNIDSERFGFNVANVNDWGTDPADLLATLIESNIKLVITRIPGEDVIAIRVFFKLLSDTDCFGVKNAIWIGRNIMRWLRITRWEELLPHQDLASGLPR